eukprot:g36953.t1
MKGTTDATEQFLYQGIMHAFEPFVMLLPARYLADYFRRKLLLCTAQRTVPGFLSTGPKKKKKKKKEEEGARTTQAGASDGKKQALEACLQSARLDWSWVGLAKVACGTKPSSAIVMDKQVLQFFVKGPLASPAAADFQLLVEPIKQLLWPDYSPLRFDEKCIFLRQLALGFDGCEPTQGGLAVSPSVRPVQLHDLLVPDLCLQVLLRLVLRFVVEASDSHLRNLVLDERTRVVVSIDEMTQTRLPLPGHGGLSELTWLFTKQANTRVLGALRACWGREQARVVEFLQSLPASTRRDELVRLIGAPGAASSSKRKRQAE